MTGRRGAVTGDGRRRPTRTRVARTRRGASVMGESRLNIDSLMVISAEMCYDSTRTFTNKTGRPGVISTLPTLITDVYEGDSND
jgi:hypothetical protein